MTIFYFKFEGVGLGDQLIGLCSWLTIARKLSIPFCIGCEFIEKSGIMTLNKKYSLESHELKEGKIIDIGEGLPECLSSPDFWKDLPTCKLVNIANNASVLPYVFLNNESTPFKFSSYEEVLKELRISFSMLFEDCIQLANPFKEYINSPNPVPLFTIHFRHGDDGTPKLPFEMWNSSDIKLKIIELMQAVKNYINTLDVKDYTVQILTDLNNESIVKIAKEFFPADKVKESYTMNHINYFTKKQEYMIMFNDFFTLAKSDKIFGTACSNFSRTACLLGSKVDNSWRYPEFFFYLYSDHKLISSIELLLKKGSNDFDKY